jgi:beta-RFAP synthase
MGRGNRSGIGIGTFRYGGFIVDGGRGAHTGAPPVVSRLPVPEAWRCVLALDQGVSGLCGNVEQEAFTRLEPMGQGAASEICRLVLMQVLPALTEQDCAAFGAGISSIQELVGEYFAPYRSPAVAEAMSFLRRQGACGAGQSSWGPAGFALFASETDAFQAMKLARGQRYDKGTLKFVLCRASNEPALVFTRDAVVKGARSI